MIFSDCTFFHNTLTILNILKSRPVNVHSIGCVGLDSLVRSKTLETWYRTMVH